MCISYFISSDIFGIRLIHGKSVSFSMKRIKRNEKF